VSGENLIIQWVSKKVKVKNLKPYEKNPRKISKEAYASLLKSLREDGYHQRLLVTSDLRIIGGHQRIKAFNELGITDIEVLVPDCEITDEQFRRILVRDNLAYGDWDYDLLAEIMPVAELQELGFDCDLLPPPPAKKGLTDEDAVPEAPDTPVAKYGDVWILGDHRVMCGDSTKQEDVARLMDGQKADMLLTDPPYNVAYEGKTKDALKIENDSMDDVGFRAFLRNAFGCGVSAMRSGAVYPQCVRVRFSIFGMLIRKVIAFVARVKMLACRFASALSGLSKPWSWEGKTITGSMSRAYTDGRMVRRTCGQPTASKSLFWNSTALRATQSIQP
jgi:hypothetical protein